MCKERKINTLKRQSFSFCLTAIVTYNLRRAVMRRIRVSLSHTKKKKSLRIYSATNVFVGFYRILCC